jgi:RHS repeat-associated protein
MMQRSWDVTYGTYHGAPKLCRPSTTICHQPTWRLRSFVFAPAATPPNYEWNGTLLEDKEDGTGRIFRRNRTVDPATGRFTQEDPIGLAGGLNVYGFANGDPINFSDPLGLCPPEDNNPYDCGSNAMGALVMLRQMAPAINHEVATFLPKSAAAAVGGIAIGRAAGALLSRLALAFQQWQGRSVAATRGPSMEASLRSLVLGRRDS